MDHIKNDQLFNLGLLASPKRFNVSITRAQALLIVVGNPYLLETDPYWEKMLSFCRVNKAYKGKQTIKFCVCVIA